MILGRARSRSKRAGCSKVSITLVGLATRGAEVVVLRRALRGTGLTQS